MRRFIAVVMLGCSVWVCCLSHRQGLMNIGAKPFIEELNASNDRR